MASRCRRRRRSRPRLQSKQRAPPRDPPLHHALPRQALHQPRQTANRSPTQNQAPPPLILLPAHPPPKVTPHIPSRPHHSAPGMQARRTSTSRPHLNKYTQSASTSMSPYPTHHRLVRLAGSAPAPVPTPSSRRLTQPSHPKTRASAHSSSHSLAGASISVRRPRASGSRT